ncbi:hypothetical protein [Flavobacterium selenitireducens]|uniref:hypothetical protein n=1 Tax=Flavobacterium selenitireducens TaxID=2722704 RepID=UPI00168B4B64|nr:hypothetical protein [Flavobacterium selenitireducens]MBD3581988.1 hypothetical protein [Flavobacterium selenitireducens]
MQTKPLPELTNEELAKEAKKRKNNYLMACVMIGSIFGIAIYATVTNGFGILTFLPVFFIPMFRPATKSYKEAKAEIESRQKKIQP